MNSSNIREEKKRQIPSEALIHWYLKVERPLPWRLSPTPYHVWISEIMLQQTRIEAVKEYYARFLKRLPDIFALAEVEEDELMKLWEGLGYYSRAKNLKKAAEIVVREHGGNLPAHYEKLIRLPGIGPYTAGAIASIAFQERVPVVDGNVLRVFTRFFADAGDIARQDTKDRIRKELEDQLPPAKDCGKFNQALMELGETICLPGGLPRCALCPIQKNCRSHAGRKEMYFPVKSSRRERKVEQRTILLVTDGARFLIRKRPATGLLAGMYEFPNEEGYLSPVDLEIWATSHGLLLSSKKELVKSKHIFTHKEWEMQGALLLVEERGEAAVADYVWAKREELNEKYAVPSAFSVYLRIAMQIENDGETLDTAGGNRL